MTCIYLMMQRVGDQIDGGHRPMIVSHGSKDVPKVHLTLAKTFMIGAKFKIRPWFGNHDDVGMRKFNQFRVQIR